MRALAIVFSGSLLAAALAVAQTQPKPPEYDVGAEVTLRGVVTEIHESKVATDHPGLHLILTNETENETFEVHACPIRFLNELGFTIEKGDALRRGRRRDQEQLVRSCQRSAVS